jgi:hypothetical protein
MVKPTVLGCFLLLAAAAVFAAAESPEERALEAIRHEMAAPADRSDGNPLPLLSGWSTTRAGSGFAPAYQLDQLRHGQYLLPWLALWEAPVPGAGAEYPHPADALYYEPTARYAAEHRLPLCIVSEEWELLMARASPEYAKAGGSITNHVPLSPFGPVAQWYEIGREWAQHGTLQRLQKIYPDPPLVLIVQDTEYPRVSSADLGAEYRADADARLIARRRAIGDAWIERYSAMLRGFRDNLDSPAWRSRVVIVGEYQFLDGAMGRYSGWGKNSLYIPGRGEPWPYAWDGVNVDFALHDYFPDADNIVWSPPIEAMNQVVELQAVRRAKPNFWLELGVWDGEEVDSAKDKRRFFAERGAPFTPERYGAMVQFGMWLLRPRVVREFRNPTDDRIRFGPYFEQLLAVVARVHQDSTLRAFWRKGRLLANPAAQHPYQENLPPDFAARPRWFLLDSPLNPTRPWQLITELKILSLALEEGERPHRHWLVYASSPLEERPHAEVVIPGGPHVQVRASPAGAFTLVSEEDGTARTVGND